MEGGRTEIRLVEGGEVLLQIEDHPSGIPQESQELVNNKNMILSSTPIAYGPNKEDTLIPKVEGHQEVGLESSQTGILLVQEVPPPNNMQMSFKSDPAELMRAPERINKPPVEVKSPITTHVLDVTKGLPAAGMAVSIYQLIEGRWTLLKEGYTNVDGRCNTLTNGNRVQPGRYKLHFDTDRYFVLHRQATIFPFIEVVFDVASDNEKHHVPVLLSPYGYSTYKGS